jgi:hypothetical protein
MTAVGLLRVALWVAPLGEWGTSLLDAAVSEDTRVPGIITFCRNLNKRILKRLSSEAIFGYGICEKMNENFASYLIHAYSSK